MPWSYVLQDSVGAILQALMTRPEAQLQSPFAKFLCLGLGLLFLGKQDVVEATMEVCENRLPKLFNPNVNLLAAAAIHSSAHLQFV